MGVRNKKLTPVKDKLENIDRLARMENDLDNERLKNILNKLDNDELLNKRKRQNRSINSRATSAEYTTTTELSPAQLREQEEKFLRKYLTKEQYKSNIISRKDKLKLAQLAAGLDQQKARFIIDRLHDPIHPEYKQYNKIIPHKIADLAKNDKPKVQPVFGADIDRDYYLANADPLNQSHKIRKINGLESGEEDRIYSSHDISRNQDDALHKAQVRQNKLMNFHQGQTAFNRKQKQEELPPISTPNKYSRPSTPNTSQKFHDDEIDLTGGNFNSQGIAHSLKPMPKSQLRTFGAKMTKKNTFGEKENYQNQPGDNYRG